MTDLEQFEKLVADFDLTYSYSDDAKVWRRGEEQSKAISEAAKKLPPDEARRAYNAMVDKKVSEQYRKMFYWRAA